MNTLVEFHGTPVNVIDHNGQRWMTAEEVGLCLGYNEANARIGISNLFNRHADEFTSADSTVINLMTVDGKKRDVRCFSQTGCNLLGFFSNTARAKEFRAFAKQVLVSRPAPMPTVHNPLLRITRQVEFDTLTLFAQGLPQREIARQLAISPGAVCQLVHARYRFVPGAGQDLTTPELIEAVVARHVSEERARITKKYCANATNQQLSSLMNDAGELMLMLDNA